MNSGSLGVRLAPWLFTVVMFVLWEAIVRLFNIPTFFLPPPTAIAKAFVDFWPAIYRNSVFTLSTTMIGFAMAVGFGLLLEFQSLAVIDPPELAQAALTH